ncbi:hypothetical protein hairong_084 [Pseudomonas phage hairong]|nr:hypothetical protein hairong_084 [Pseudomonas phage hairong]
MKLIGLTGAHGTGKTTLAAKAAGEFGWEFAKTDVSGVYLKQGLDPRESMSLITRLSVQQEILDLHREQWNQLRRVCPTDHVVVTDRTPYCFIAFMLAEISGYGKLNPVQDAAVVNYVNECHQVAEELFDMVCYIPRSIPFIPATHKVQAVASEAYREHWDMLIQGILFGRAPNHWEISAVSIEDRLKELKTVASAV